MSRACAVHARLVLFKSMNPTPSLTLEKVTLYYREGGSDKVYQAAIEPSGTGFVVNIAFGRRGSTLNTGTKTSSPVEYAVAQGIYGKVVREKMAKGYTPGPDGTPYQHTPHTDRVTNILPQLLNPIDEPELQRLLVDKDHCAQEKFDGHRMLLRKEGTTVTGINRKGLIVCPPASLIAAAQNLPGDFLLDGESVGEILHVFDLLALNGEDLRPLSYWQRYQSLLALFAAAKQRALKIAPCFTSTEGKHKLWCDLRELKREGIVFKRLDAPYTPGRPNSGGTQLKYKFTATLSAVVAKVNAQRSVELRLIGKDGWVTAGNVTIPPNHSVPATGSVVEARYYLAIQIMPSALGGPRFPRFSFGLWDFPQFATRHNLRGFGEKP